jgi:copper homeostasis protein CutC
VKESIKARSNVLSIGITAGISAEVYKNLQPSIGQKEEYFHAVSISACIHREHNPTTERFKASYSDQRNVDLRSQRLVCRYLMLGENEIGNR